jgi:hypothetical protein
VVERIASAVGACFLFWLAWQSMSAPSPASTTQVWRWLRVLFLALLSIAAAVAGLLLGSVAILGRWPDWVEIGR